jgi:response regulator of citrate/malate metabolism
MKSDAQLKTIPVVMVTSSRNERDLLKSYQLGANGYVVKPTEFNQFFETIMGLSLFWAVINEPPPSNNRIWQTFDINIAVENYGK